MSRTLSIAVGIAGFMLGAAVALASGFDPDEIAFPVDGDHSLSGNFGACRDGCARFHEGEDITADKGVPVVAAADGVVTWISTTCCNLGIDHGDGWVTRYIHLNDDTQNPDGTYTDDDEGWGIADGIEVGTEVEKGQLIGWVGDSGNAKGGPPHLHFELRKDGEAIDPLPYLERALGIWNRQFQDVDGSVHEANIERIYQAGITKGCNPPANDRFCPDEFVTRGQMAAFLARMLGLSEADEDFFVDDESSIFQADINAMAAAGITRGCNPPANDRFCPERTLTRGEMGAFLARALGLPRSDQDFFVDDENSIFQAEINAMAEAGITRGCNPPDNDRFCPERTLTRAEMASFLARSLDWLNER